MTDRFNSDEDAPSWDRDAFDAGHNARLTGLTLSACTEVGFLARSWRAGWADADQTSLEANRSRLLEGIE